MDSGSTPGLLKRNCVVEEARATTYSKVAKEFMKPYFKRKVCFCYKLTLPHGVYFGISRNPGRRMLDHIFGKWAGVPWQFEIVMWDVDTLLVAAAEIESIVQTKKSGAAVLNKSLGGEFPAKSKHEQRELKRMRTEAKKELAAL